VRHIGPSEDLHPVLDVGCGPFPIPEADFVVDCEPYAYDLPEMRARLKGRFVRADVHALPFADGTFGFVHCSNVLEHVEDPARGFKQLQRVGRHGFAESPTAFRERIVIHPDNHRWIISWPNGAIRFQEPRQVEWRGVQLLPLPFSRWIKKHLPLCWKGFMFLTDQALNIAFNKVRW
jgi:SAM-dependent methyltransferase